MSLLRKNTECLLESLYEFTYNLKKLCVYYVKYYTQTIRNAYKNIPVFEYQITYPFYLNRTTSEIYITE